MNVRIYQLNETKEKTPSKQDISKKGYSLEYLRGIKNTTKQLQKTLS